MVSVSSVKLLFSIALFNVRFQSYTLLLALIVCAFVFKDKIQEYRRRNHNIKQITEDCKTIGVTPFSVKYVGDNKYEVVFEDPAAVKGAMKLNNKVTYIYDVKTNELALSDSDNATWLVRKSLYMKKNAKKPAAPAEAAAPAAPAAK